MRSRWFITGCLALSQTTCSFLFSESESSGVADAGFPGIVDATPQLPCPGSMTLGPGGGQDLLGAQVLDLNHDGRDELVLLKDAGDNRSQVIIHDGTCLMTQPLDYQVLWLPDGSVPTAEFVPQTLALARSRTPSEQRLVVLAEEDQVPSLASYTVGANSMGTLTIGTTPTFVAPLPQYPNNDGCKSPEPPYSILAGDFDSTSAGDQDDLIFSAGQSWVYRVDGWTTTPMWDAGCESNGVDTGSVPDKVSGSGKRYGFTPVPVGGSAGDEVISIRTKQVNWIHNNGVTSQLTRWPRDQGVDVDVVGAALSRSAVADDSEFYAVAWEDTTPLRLHAVKLSNPQEHLVVFKTFTLDLGASRPTSGRVLSVMGKQRLLLLVDDVLYLLDPDAMVDHVVDQVTFEDFTPNFFVTPNWGTDLQPLVLSFDSDTGDYLCHSFDTEGEFVPCDG